MPSRFGHRSMGVNEPFPFPTDCSNCCRFTLVIGDMMAPIRLAGYFQDRVSTRYIRTRSGIGGVQSAGASVLSTFICITCGISTHPG